MLATISFILRQAEETAEEHGNDPAHLYPHWEELVVGALAFAVLFFFVWKWVLPRLRQLLDERREKIQGELERAEETRRAAEQELAEYRERLAASREEANRIIEEARRTFLGRPETPGATGGLLDLVPAHVRHFVRRQDVEYLGGLWTISDPQVLRELFSPQHGDRRESLPRSRLPGTRSGAAS